MLKHPSLILMAGEVMQSLDGCKLNNWDNLVVLYNWDSEKESLTVVNDKLLTQPSLNADTIRKVTQMIFTTLETLFQTVSKARKELLSHAPNANLVDCADTVDIFITCWQTSIRNKIEKVIKIAEEENASRISLFKIFTNRDEIDRLKTIYTTIKESKEIPTTFTFKTHVGSNITGSIISETILVDQHSTVERRVYRVPGVKNLQKNEKCNESHVSLEIHRETYKQETGELIYRLENGAPTLRLCYVSHGCFAFVPHDCPVLKAKLVVEQVLFELGTCSIVAPETAEFRSFVMDLLRKRTLASDVLLRKHPFFAQIKP